MDRIEEVFAEAELSDKGTAHIPARSGGPEVEFRNVSFAYGEKETLASRWAMVMIVFPRVSSDRAAWIR